MRGKSMPIVPAAQLLELAAAPVLEMDIAESIPVLVDHGQRVFIDQGDVRGIEAELLASSVCAISRSISSDVSIVQAYVRVITDRHPQLLP